MGTLCRATNVFEIILWVTEQNVSMISAGTKDFIQSVPRHLRANLLAEEQTAHTDLALEEKGVGLVELLPSNEGGLINLKMFHARPQNLPYKSDVPYTVSRRVLPGEDWQSMY